MKQQNRRGFTIVDTAVGVAALGVLGTLAAVGMGASRQNANLAICTAKLNAISQGNAQFAQANNGLMAGLTWLKGGNNSQYPDLNAQQAESLQGAHAAQVVDLLRRRGRTDIPPITPWIPDPNFWSMGLVEFQNRPLSDPFNICPSHDEFNKWRRHPAAFDQGRFLPRQPSPSVINKRWPYASSYSLTGSAWDRNQSVFTPVAEASRVSQHGNAHNQYMLPGMMNIGPSPMSMVALPSQKVHVHDSHQRHFAGTNLYFMYDDSTQPILFFDGSVRIEATRDARMSWAPNAPTGLFGTQVIYTPATWEPPTASGAPVENFTDRYRWTRDGLLGWDFTN